MRNNPVCSNEVREPQIDRRSFLRKSAITLLASSALLPDAIAQQRRRLRPVLWITMDGGMPQTEMLDPKPGAPEQIRGPFGTVASSIPGVRVGEHFPRVAGALRHTTLLRARKTKVAEHLPGMQAMLMARPDGQHLLTDFSRRMNRIPYAYAQTSDVIQAFPYRRDAYSVPRRATELLWNRTIGRYAVPEFGEWNAEEMQPRRNLLDLVNRGFVENEQTRQSDILRQQAFELLGQEQTGMDLDEDDIERYGGENELSVGILTMRELVKQGIAGALLFRAGNWDYHSQILNDFPKQALKLDAAVSAIIEDLHDGLLGDTLLVVSSEIGRVPMVGRRGRDHAAVYSSLLAGGPFKQRFVYGATNNHLEAVSDVVDDVLHARVIQEAIQVEPNMASRRELPPVFS